MEKRIIDSIIAVRALCRFEEKIGGECRLTPREVSALSVMSASLSAGELAERMGLSPSRASRVIAGLRDKRCLTESFDAHDRRAVSLTLTKSGERLRDAIEKKRNECEARLVQRLAAGRVQAIRAGLAELVTAMEEMDDEE